MKDQKENNSLLEFDYSKQDSIFYNSKSYSHQDRSAQKLMEKGVDSKRELLDFRNAKIDENKNNARAKASKIVNVNNASVEVLSGLPGVGIKIAQNIIDYRKKQGKIKKAEELLYIKGIGKAKFDKIKSLITVN
ncbi:MAG: helix-hairpin-helix domain-containing protein [Ignavibacteriales bacterium]|nr:helix-hairpin-helix domain-containing protein [Ignavibacteriales bacterium]